MANQPNTTNTNDEAARRAMAEAEVRQEMQNELNQRIEQKLAEGGGQPTPAPDENQTA